MRKYFISVVVLIILGLFIFLNMVVGINIGNNKRVLNIIGDIFYKDDVNVGSVYEYEYWGKTPILEIDGIDYVGVVHILDEDLTVPIQSSCDNFIFGIQSGCSYGTFGDSLFVIGTGFSDSFKNYDMYDVGDIIVYMNMFGENYHYKIESIKRVDKLDDILEYAGDMVLVVKDYLDMEYVFFVCKSD